MIDYSIKRYHTYTKPELLSSIKKYAELRRTKHISGPDFSGWSGVALSTIKRKFGSWTKFCHEARLKPTSLAQTTKEDLFRNLESVWEKLGRQPRLREMKKPISDIGESKYYKTFGNWFNACSEFLAWKSGLSKEEFEAEIKSIEQFNTDRENKHRTRRDINLSLRYDVLKRDNFKCVACGKSPALFPQVTLHIDHIVPYSRGGESELDNLQTLCKDCNLGKSDKM